MKNSLLLLLCLFSLSIFAQDKPIMAEKGAATESEVTEGMAFVEMPFDELLAMAKKENKVIFIDAYTTWCGPCKMMAAKVFPDAKVGTVYNERFINAKFDMEKGEGPGLAKRYSVRAYPTYLFVDGNGDIVHKGIGYIPQEEFLALADAATGENSLGAMNKSYDGGERSAEFLLDYYNVLNDVYEKQKASTVGGEYLNNIEDWSGENILSMLIASPGELGGKRMNYLIEHSDVAMKAAPEEFIGQIENALVKNYQETEGSEDLPSETVMAAFYKKNTGNMAKRLAAHYPMYKANKQRDRDAYMTGMVTYYDQFPSESAGELNSLAWTIFENSEDQKALKSALAWAKKSVEMGPSYANMDTLAWLYNKTGDKKMAKETATAAIELAKKEGQDYSETAKILEEK